MTLQQLKKELRQGKTPEDLGAELLGHGGGRTAWKVGPFAIKKHTDWRDLSDIDSVAAKRNYNPAALRKQGIRFAPTIELENGWVIQLAYRPIPRENPKGRFSYVRDIRTDNAGLDRRGRIVAFDW